MDFPGSEDAFFNWDLFYQDPFTSYQSSNVIYPNTQAYPSPAPSTASSTHHIMELGTMGSCAAIPQVFPGFQAMATATQDQQQLQPSLLPPSIAPPPMVPAQFQCDEVNCGKVFTKQSALVNHKSKHCNTSKKYPCDECTDAFPSTHDRTMHKIHKHEGRRYSAKKNNTQKIKTVAKTSKSFPGRRFECDKCHEFFMHKPDLLNHIRNRHTGTGEFPCTYCSAVFYTYDMFIEHRDLHDESITKYSCKECDKKFLTERKLKDHSAIHRERTFFQCQICAMVFVRSQTLQYHRMTCRAEFKCDRCVDSFMSEEALKKHQELHLKAPKFTCEKCNKTFTDQWTLQNHDKRHMLKMNYTCCVCGDLNGTRANYLKHLKDHIEANLRCKDCGEGFSNLVKYGYHKAEMHASLRPYDCILCTGDFCTRKELFDHLQNHNQSGQ